MRHLILTGFLVLFSSALLCTTTQAFDLQQAINEWLETGEGEIVLPAGTHRIDETIMIEKADGLTIRGEGAHLVFTRRMDGFNVNDSKNITLANFTIDYDPLLFSQGKIVDLEPSGRWYDVEIFEGYPNGDLLNGYLQRGPKMLIMDPENLSIKENSRDQYYANSVEKLSDNLFRVRFESPTNVQSAVGVGDYAVLRSRGGGGAIRFNNVENSLVDNITIYGSPDMAVREDGSSANVYRGIYITPGKKPAGATVERYFSINADAFHSKRAKIGPIVENCFFELMGDDSVNIGGTMDFILGGSGKILYISPKVVGFLKPEGKAQISDGENFDMKGVFEIAEVTWIENPESWMRSTARELWEGHHSPRNNGGVYEVQLTTEVEVNPGDIFSDLDRIGTGAIVRNNTFRGHRARGVLLKAHNSLIEGNTFESISMVAISITPEYYWMEGPIPRNVRIRNNRFINNGLADKAHLATNRWGDISIFIDPYSRTETLEIQGGRGITNITIENNWFEGSAFSGIMLLDTTGAVIAGNTIHNTSSISENVLAVAQNMDFSSSGLYVDDCANVEIRDNTIRHVPQYGMFIKDSTNVRIFGNNQIISFVRDKVERNASILKIEGVEGLVVEGIE